MSYAPSTTKFCRTCGTPVHENAIACPKCGVPPKIGKAYCYACGGETRPEAIICVKCGLALSALPTAKTTIGSLDTGNLSLWGYFIKCFVHYADFNGRARREEFWGFVLFNDLFFFALDFIFLPLCFLYSLATFSPFLAVTWRRFHDLGLNGTVALPGAIAYGLALLFYAASFAADEGSAAEDGCLTLWLILTLASLVYILLFATRDSKPDDNQYGPNPKEGV